MLFNLFQAFRPEGSESRDIGGGNVVKMLCLTMMVGLTASCASVMEDASQAVSGAQEIVPTGWQDASSTPIESGELLQWWSNFEDATLTDLIEQALASNNDIAAAQGRLRSARASAEAAGGARLPSVGFDGQAVRQESLKGPSMDSRSYSLGMDAAWEVDLFGKLRNSATAAEVSAQGSEAGLYDIQRIIAAEVAFNYINLRDAQQRLAVARANLEIQRENLQIASWRNKAGQGDALEVEQARTVVAQTKAGIPVLEQSVANAINQIDVLMGKPPGSSVASLVTATTSLPAPPAIAGVGLPADLLARRPDILSAQHSLEAEVIRIGVAEADLYPALRLSGSLDTSSNSAGDLFDASVGSLIGGVTAPIFQGGQIRARIEQQKGNADVALANYRSAILAALQDVENALVAARSAEQREAALGEAEEAAVASLVLAEIRYQSGAIDFQTLLDAQRNLLSVQDSRVSAYASRSTAAVQLFKALGGGWNAPQSL